MLAAVGDELEITHRASTILVYGLAVTRYRSAGAGRTIGDVHLLRYWKGNGLSSEVGKAAMVRRVRVCPVREQVKA